MSIKSMTYTIIILCTQEKTQIGQYNSSGGGVGIRENLLRGGMNETQYLILKNQLNLTRF